MRKPLTCFFIVFLIIGFVVYLSSYFNIWLPKIIRFYVNDFVITPIVLTISLFVMQKLRNDKNYTIPLIVVLYLCSLYTVIFEYMLPKFHPRYTTDIVDVILYFFGGILFYYLQKKN